ncbi:DNA-binding protein Alba [Candidatus Bathyarchaeota archaeon]|jgi:DNA-binding protein|nr:DNA-binding protein Alba [Candidatus Bathyarchaeota archaeon]
MTVRQENLVRVGKKPVMNYVVACVTLFNSGKDEIVLRARGQSINNAVDIVERLRKFQKNLQVRDISIGSEDITRPDGTRASISTIEIALRKE